MLHWASFSASAVVAKDMSVRELRPDAGLVEVEQVFSTCPWLVRSDIFFIPLWRYLESAGFCVGTFLGWFRIGARLLNVVPEVNTQRGGFGVVFVCCRFASECL